MNARGRDGYIAWLKANVSKTCFAPFTGQDYAALAAWIAMLDLYFRADGAGQYVALEGLRCALRAMQDKCWHVAKRAIPAIGDWTHEEPLWAKVIAAADFQERLEELRAIKEPCPICGGKAKRDTGASDGE